MNIVVAHGFAHRRMSNGLVESAPFDQVHDDTAWAQRSLEEMDLTGGDFELIAELLERLSYIFALDVRRVPTSNRPEEVPVVQPVVVM